MCQPGYYCPEGSLRSNEVKCGDGGRYCPKGSPHPITVKKGYYSADIHGTTSTPESTRSQQLLTPKGHYSIDGLLYKCPAGYYGATEGIASISCSGRCNIPGFYCPAGSVSPQMRICGADDLFCPAGTAAPIKVYPGFYTGDYLYELCPPGKT